MAVTRFKHPHTQYTEVASTSLTWCWCLLFGTFYFLYRGIWHHAALSFLLAILTGGISWLIYPFFAPQIVRNHYERQGWARQ